MFRSISAVVVCVLVVCVAQRQADGQQPTPGSKPVDPTITIFNPPPPTAGLKPTSFKVGQMKLHSQYQPWTPPGGFVEDIKEETNALQKKLSDARNDQGTAQAKPQTPIQMEDLVVIGNRLAKGTFNWKPHVKGSSPSTAGDHANWIAKQSVSGGASNPQAHGGGNLKVGDIKGEAVEPANSCEHQDFMIAKFIDKATPGLPTGLKSNTVAGTGYFKIKTKDILVSGYNVAGGLRPTQIPTAKFARPSAGAAARVGKISR